MSHHLPAPEGKDPALWDIAQKRASFKRHLATYLVINAFLWVLWYFTGRHSAIEIDADDMHWNYFPWPLWTTIGWGIGLAFHFAGAYIYPHANTVEKEYQKLQNKK
jgi:hypothetical protein